MQLTNKFTSRNVRLAMLVVYSALALALMAGLGRVHAAGVPENVTGLTATAIDSASVGLSWNTAKDGDGTAVDHYRIYYGTVSVQTVGAGEYEKAVNTPNNSTSYVVGGLTANTVYYFTVTAANAQGTESDMYSQESSAATKAAAGAPAEQPPAGGEPEPEAQPEPAETPAAEPAVTPPAAPITTPETTPPAAEQGDKTAPTVETVEALYKNKVKVVFSEAVKLPEALPQIAFTVAEQLDPTKELVVTVAVVDPEDKDGNAVILTTKDQTKDVNYVVTAGVAVTDVAGNPIESGNRDSGMFTGTDKVEPPVVDTTPPEDVTNLMLSFKKQLERFVVLMDWTASVNTAKDLVDQLLYMSMDRGKTYDKGMSLGPTVTHNEVPNLVGGKEYTFKITTKDAVGNESVGVVKSIRLPQTGVAVGIFLIGSAALAGRILRRKKK